jgi:sarcosine oxidase
VSSSQTTRDVAVVGAGIVGLSVARELRAAGATVHVYERGVPGNGQSGGESRIFRHAHDDIRLVELAKRSRAIWREWEADLGIELVSGDGAVALGEAALEKLALLERAGGIDAARVDADELRERLPLLAPYDGPAVIDRDGGSIRTTAAIAALSNQLGDDLIADEVLSVTPDDNGVELRAGGVHARYGSVVVCAGRGTQALARTAGLSLPIEDAAHLRLTFAAKGNPPSTLACLQDSSGEFPETGIYAAAEPGNARYGVGLSETTDAGEDGALTDPAALASLGERAAAYVREALPGLDPEPVEHRHCWVTTLPWSEDGVGVWSVGSCRFVAGHNLFKLAPVLGRELASAATGGKLTPELLPESRVGEPREG